MFLFIASVFLAVFTIIPWLQYIGFHSQELFVSFFPTLLFYLSSITTSLSLCKNLSGSNVFLVQMFLFLCTFIGIRGFMINIHSVKRFFFNIWNHVKQQKFSLPITLVLLLISLIMLLSFILRFVTPTLSFDDVVYRASTPLYWIQHKSIFRFPTLMEQKNIFLYSTGILLMWPNLFKTGELITNVLYWTAYPITIVLMYLTGSFFTKNKLHRLCSILLYISAPIIFRNASLILIQENWMAVVLLSCAYILLYVLNKRVSLHPLQWIYMGASFAILPQIKPTGWFYMIFLVLLYKHIRIKQTITILIGVFLSLIVSGYLFMIVQNYAIYKTPGGSKEFTKLHTASLSINQLSIHTLRIPFAFLKIPCYTDFCFSSVNTVMQKAITFLGANRELPYETSEEWIGKFEYTIDDPDKNLGIGGILFLFWVLLSIKKLYDFSIRKKPLSSQQLFMLTLIAIVMAQLYIIRWEDHSGVPYKHLVGIFALISLFSYKLFSWIERHQNKNLFYCLLIFSYTMLITPLFPTVIDTITNFRIYSYERQPKLLRLQDNPYKQVVSLFPYESHIMLIEPFNAPDYQLFKSNNNHWNTITLFALSPTISINTAVEEIKKQYQVNNIAYIGIQDQQELIDALLQQDPNISLLKKLPFEQSTISFLQIR